IDDPSHVRPSPAGACRYQTERNFGVNGRSRGNLVDGARWLVFIPLSSRCSGWRGNTLARSLFFEAKTEPTRALFVAAIANLKTARTLALDYVIVSFSLFRAHSFPPEARLR